MSSHLQQIEKVLLLPQWTEKVREKAEKKFVSKFLRNRDTPGEKDCKTNIKQNITVFPGDKMSHCSLSHCLKQNYSVF